MKKARFLLFLALFPAVFTALPGVAAFAAGTADSPQLFWDAFEQNRNGIFIALSAVIAMGGAAILLGKRAAELKTPKRWWLLGGACLAVLICAFIAYRYGYVLFSLSDQPLWERVKLATGLFLLLMLSVFAMSLRSDTPAHTLSAKKSYWRALVCLILFLAAQAAALIFLLRMHCTATVSLLNDAKSDRQNDFVSLLQIAKTDPYGDGVYYTPLCLLLFKILGLLVPNTLFSANNPASAIIRSQEGQLALLVFVVLCGAAIFALASHAMRRTGRIRFIVAAALLISAPFLYSLQQGSAVLLSAVSAMYFVFHYTSQKAFSRELSVAALAVAAAIYSPAALLALLLVFDRRWMQLLRWIVYTILLVLLPITLFGGLDQMPRFLINLLLHWVEKPVMGQTASFAGALGSLTAMFTGSAVISVGHRVAAAVLFVLLLTAAGFSRGWKRVLCLCLLLCGGSAAGSPGAMLFILPAVIAFLRENRSAEKSGTMDGVYLFLLLCMLICFPTQTFDKLAELPLWQYGETGRQTLTILIQGLSLVAAALTITGDTFHHLLHPRAVSRMGSNVEAT